MVSPLRRSALWAPHFIRDRGLAAILITFVLLLPLLWPRIYAVDSVEYYSYLPSLVFDHDLDFTNEYSRLDALNPDAGIRKGLLDKTDPITHRPINVAPIGTAILWTPAFLLAHAGVLALRALGVDIAADGFSRPYIWAVAFATAVYGLGGLLLAYGLARRYASMWSAAVAVIVCWIASPVIFFMYVNPPWSHVPALFVVGLFIIFWLNTRGTRTTTQWALLGLLGGLLTLCREQLGLFMLLPAGEALAQYWKLLREGRWRSIGGLVGRHCLFLLVVALMVAPQFLVYHALNGRWGPSKNVSGKFLWWSPYFFQTLLNPRNGALFWTPVWLLGIVGLALLWRRDRGLTFLFGLALVAQVYINGTFKTWHLSGSFGFRRMIELTPLFVLGVALLLDTLRPPRWATLALAALLIGWNFGLIAQWALPPRPIKNGLVWNGMLARQIGIVQRVIAEGDTLLFKPCKFVDNGGCR
jgi:hypothetical protein